MVSSLLWSLHEYDIDLLKSYLWKPPPNQSFSLEKVPPSFWSSKLLVSYSPNIAIVTKVKVLDGNFIVEGQVSSQRHPNSWSFVVSLLFKCSVAAILLFTPKWRILISLGEEYWLFRISCHKTHGHSQYQNKDQPDAWGGRAIEIKVVQCNREFYSWGGGGGGGGGGLAALPNNTFDENSELLSSSSSL